MIYHHILVAYDGSEAADKALKQAVELTERNMGSKLTVVHVLYRSALSFEGFVGIIPGDYQEKLREYEDALIQKASERISVLSYAEIIVVTGYPATVILETAADRNCDLIVMGSRGLGAFKEWMLGSVSHHVVQHARIPVLVVK
ncbi:universal stress protein [Cohnella candidum]|nr:universal stress protein [Cohnella candidum]